MKTLYVIGNPGCRPCVEIKNELASRLGELEELKTDFIYVTLNELEDKDSFIQKHGLTATPTIWVEQEGKKVFEHSGFIDVDTLLETIGGLK